MELRNRGHGANALGEAELEILRNQNLETQKRLAVETEAFLQEKAKFVLEKDKASQKINDKKRYHVAKMN